MPAVSVALGEGCERIVSEEVVGLTRWALLLRAINLGATNKLAMGDLRKLLTDLGHRVTVAASAGEGLRLVEERAFDIVFTDLAMPKQDGVAAAIAIKARRPQTRIVLMSGYGSERASERAAETDCIDATLNKPFRVFEIQAALRLLLT